MKCLCIDPSGTGTTGMVLFGTDSKESKPNTVIYENTTYIYGRQHQGTVGLYKLIGGIMALRYVFDFIQEVTSIAVNQVKPFKDKLFRGQEQIEGLTCQVGRGKG
ncbi:16633_t:CDS:2 [Funneliformis geosporum]|uniref:16633_t:CDS:1 n=1 Tax=Funneliformis geosporum TaxID=1117311 RepID=A0A9W4SBG5_9GLOM|nr:16633_t:CDS:2 [Funneliformis geosporum]